MNHKNASTQENSRGDGTEGKRMREVCDFSKNQPTNHPTKQTKNNKRLYTRNIINGPGIMLDQLAEKGCFSGDVRGITFLKFSGLNFSIYEGKIVTHA